MRGCPYIMMTAAGQLVMPPLLSLKKAELTVRLLKQTKRNNSATPARGQNTNTVKPTCWPIIRSIILDLLFLTHFARQAWKNYGRAVQSNASVVVLVYNLQSSAICNRWTSSYLWDNYYSKPYARPWERFTSPVDAVFSWCPLGHRRPKNFNRWPLLKKRPARNVQCNWSYVSKVAMNTFEGL